MAFKIRFVQSEKIFHVKVIFKQNNFFLKTGQG